MRAKPPEHGVALLPTLTHARIRAAQGDPRGARRILEEILGARPEDAEARTLLEEIGLQTPRARAEEPSDEPVLAALPGDPSSLRARFHAVSGGSHAAVIRLSDYLERIRRTRERES